MKRTFLVATLIALATTACFVEIIEPDTTVAGETGSETGESGESGTDDDTEHVCGDGVREATELCDGGDLDDMSCEDLGLTKGTLACADDCTFDVSGCGSAPACGNGMIEGDEECDGEDLGGRNCESLGYTGGTLQCGDECTLDASQCVEA